MYSMRRLDSTDNQQFFNFKVINVYKQLKTLNFILSMTVENPDWIDKNYPKILYEHYGNQYDADGGIWLSDTNGELILLTTNKGIYRYKSSTDDWNKIMDYPDKNKYQMSPYADATQRINNKNKIIMLCDCSFSKIHSSSYELVEFNLDCKTFEYLSNGGLTFPGYSTKLFCDINDNIHYFTQERLTDVQSHYMFDFQTKLFKLQETSLPIIYKKPVFVGYNNRNSIFMSITKGNYPYKVHIMEYLCRDKNKDKDKGEKWNIWDCIDGINYNSHILTIDDENNRYLIIFGGQNLNKKGRKDGIDFTIYDLKKNELYQSELKFPRPHPGASDIVIVRDKNRDNCLVFGFLRDWKDSKKLILNEDLVNMIADFVCFDNIHWIERGILHAAVRVDQLFSYIVSND